MRSSSNNVMSLQEYTQNKITAAYAEFLDDIQNWKNLGGVFTDEQIPNFCENFLKTLNELEILEPIPQILNQQIILQFFSEKPEYAAYMINNLRGGVAQKFIETAIFGDKTPEAEERWKQFLASTTSDVNSSSSSSLDSQKKDNQKLVKLRDAILPVHREIVYGTHIREKIYNLENEIKDIEKHIANQNDKKGLTKLRVNELQKIIDESEIKNFTIGNSIVDAEELSKHIKEIKAICEKLDKIMLEITRPNPESVNLISPPYTFINTHHKNPKGLFKSIRGEDTTQFSLVKTLAYSANALKYELEKLSISMNEAWLDQWISENEDASFVEKREERKAETSVTRGRDPNNNNDDISSVAKEGSSRSSRSSHTGSQIFELKKKKPQSDIAENDQTNTGKLTSTSTIRVKK